MFTFVGFVKQNIQRLTLPGNLEGWKNLIALFWKRLSVVSHKIILRLTNHFEVLFDFLLFSISTFVQLFLKKEEFRIIFEREKCHNFNFKKIKQK